MYSSIARPVETEDLRTLVKRIVVDHQMPLEERILRGDELTDDDYSAGTEAAKVAGLWGLSTPELYGGADLSVYNLINAQEVAAWSLAQLRFGGEVPEALLTAQGLQKQRYADPMISGEMRYAFAQTEPSGGSDPGGGLRTRAVRDGDSWVINGNKVFISRVSRADVVLVVAVTDGNLRQRGGVSMLVVEKDNPGLHITREIPVLGGMKIHELFLDNCRVPDFAMLGATGSGFRQAQRLLSTARMVVAATALGIADRALEMMVEFSKDRTLFGSRLCDKQEVQRFIVDSWMEVQQARLALYNAATRTDQGYDTRVEAGMVKILGTETVGRVIDRAIQVYGASGCALDNPLAHWYGLQRLARIYEGPTEVHKFQVIAKKLLNG